MFLQINKISTSEPRQVRIRRTLDGAEITFRCLCIVKVLFLKIITSNKTKLVDISLVVSKSLFI